MTDTINYMGLDGFAWFVGVVEDRNDPEQLGRVRVRCLGWHTEDLSGLPTAELPWAHVMHPVTDPSMHGMGTTPSFLLEGGWVVGFFRDTEYQQPVIIGTLPGVPLDPADFTKGFNDPRHKKSTQVNFTGKKQYAKEDKDGEVYNPGEGGGTIEDYNPAYSQQSYGPYPLGGFVNGEDDSEGLFSRSSGHTVKESDTNRLARNAGHGVLNAKDSAALSGVMIAHSDQALRDEFEELPQGYADDQPRDVGLDIYGNREKKDDEFLDNAGKYPTQSGKGTGPNASPRVSHIELDKGAHPYPAAGSPQTVDASGFADAINPLKYEADPELTAEKWNEPKTTDKNKSGSIRYAAKYPYNHVFESESGHIKEYDDTPGSERIHEYHMSGTFYEVDADGNKHTRVVGNNYEILAGNDFVNIRGDVNLTIESNCKTYIKGDWNIQVDGNKYETVKGNVLETYGTDLQTVHGTLVHGARMETVESNVIETYGTDLNSHFHTLLVTGSSNHTVTRNVTETFGSDKGKDSRSTTIVGTEAITVESSTTYTLKDTWTGTTAKAWTHTTSSGDIRITGGPDIHLNP